MDTFVTTYSKDYKTKPIPTVIRPTTNQEYNDPLTIGFKEFLKLRKTASSLNSPDEEYDDEYLKKFKVVYPKLGKAHFSEPINETVVAEDCEKNGLTIYQLHYCDIEKDRRYADELKKRNVYTLPEDWVLPSTSYHKSYRNPTVLNPRALEVVPKIPARNNLKCQEKVNKILHVQTGESQYQAVIGKLGDIIMQDEMHGKIVHPKCTCVKHNSSYLV